jgi:predicted GIY-YIG superfamily endonuclease
MPDLHQPIACPNYHPGLFWVYILQSADGTYYVGQTSDLPERLRKHRLGLGSKHTQDHVVPQLVYAEPVDSLVAAVKRERQLKRWSRPKKEALIRGDFATMCQLSRSREKLRWGEFDQRGPLAGACGRCRPRSLANRYAIGCR